MEATERVVIHPFLGEFGWLVMRYMRYVHQLKAKEKIVCCLKGMECLFPSATGFFTDFSNPIPDKYRRISGSSRNYNSEIEELQTRIKKQYPDYTHITRLHHIDPWHWSNLIKFKLSVPNKLPIVDIVFGARKRQFDVSRNYPHWQTIAQSLQYIGLTVGVVGAEDSTDHVKNCIYAWDHPDGSTVGSVDLLSNCRLYLGLDSGVSHLAALIDTPMLISVAPKTPHPIHTIMERASFKYCKFVETEHWNSPTVFLGRIIQALYDSSHPSEFKDDGAGKWLVDNEELPEKGTIVDIGVGSGIRDSVSYAFERGGWKCLIAETNSRINHRLHCWRDCRIERGELTLKMIREFSPKIDILVISNEDHRFVKLNPKYLILRDRRFESKNYVEVFRTPIYRILKRIPNG